MALVISTRKNLLTSHLVKGTFKIQKHCTVQFSVTSLLYISIVYYLSKMCYAQTKASNPEVDYSL